MDDKTLREIRDVAESLEKLHRKLDSLRIEIDTIKRELRERSQ